MGRRVTRADKIASEKGFSESSKRTQNKYIDSNGIKNFHLTERQKEFYDVIDSNVITFVKGCPGSGKSNTALYYAVKNYLTNPSDNIIVVRTPVEVGCDKIGFLPSELRDKIAPHFSSAKVLLENLLSKGKVEADLEKRIHFLIPNYMLGVTIDNSVLLLDEAQELNPLTLKLILERIGTNTKVIVAGDPSQLYSNDKSRNGLTDAINRFFEKDEEGNLTPKYPGVGYFEFTERDIVRSDIVKCVVAAYKDINIR